MRITGGRFTNRRIEAPQGKGTRPSTERLREALYSILAARMELTGVEVLDLYSGSGALALEAISRGAARATCIELSRKAAAIIERNAASLGLSELLEVRCTRALEVLGPLKSQGKRFDLIVADPPYGKEAELLLAAIAANPPLDDDGLVVIEHAWREPLASSFENLTQVFSRNYGDSALAIYSFAAPRVDDET